MEIIEETIRYIDALHHQLAIKMDQHSDQQQQQREERGDDGQERGGGDAGQQEQSVPHVIQCKVIQKFDSAVA